MDPGYMLSKYKLDVAILESKYLFDSVLPWVEDSLSVKLGHNILPLDELIYMFVETNNTRLQCTLFMQSIYSNTRNNNSA